MGDSRVVIDRRGFLGLAAATSAVAATGVVGAAGCQGGPGDTPPTQTQPPPASPPAAGELYAAPLRTAVVPDDVAPALWFQPVRRTPT
jgi:hypothetical protein